MNIRETRERAGLCERDRSQEALPSSLNYPESNPDPGSARSQKTLAAQWRKKHLRLLRLASQTLNRTLQREVVHSTALSLSRFFQGVQTGKMVYGINRAHGLHCAPLLTKASMAENMER